MIDHITLVQAYAAAVIAATFFGALLTVTYCALAYFDADARLARRVARRRNESRKARQARLVRLYR
jgi:hypothetical protein